MRLFDVNVLVYAHRADTSDHPAYREAVESELRSDRAYGVSDHVLAGFLRIVTHRRIFKTPTPLGEALGFVAAFRDRPNAVPVRPGTRHWAIFTELCTTVNARGNLIPGAWLAALVIEAGAELVTTDGDYARFPGLRWRHPLR